MEKNSEFEEGGTRLKVSAFILPEYSPVKAISPFLLTSKPKILLIPRESKCICPSICKYSRHYLRQLCRCMELNYPSLFFPKVLFPCSHTLSIRKKYSATENSEVREENPILTIL